MRFSLGLVVALGILAPRDADACSPSSCVAGSFLPASGGQLPLNAPGFVWRPTDTLYRTETSTAWDTLRIRRGDETLTYAVHRLPTAEFGRSMFLVTVEDALFEGDELVDVRHTLDPTLLPWRDLLLYETRVDALPLQSPGTDLDFPIGESWQGRPHDALYSVCAARGTPYPLLAPGRHAVRRVVWIPGLEPTWETNALTADTSCPPEDRIPVNIDRCMLNPVDGGFPDAGEPDAASADAGAITPVADGCTCVRVRRESAAMGLVLLLLVRRRRR